MSFLFHILLLAGLSGYVTASQGHGSAGNKKPIYYYKLWGVRTVESIECKSLSNHIHFYIDQGEDMPATFYKKIAWDELGLPTEEEVRSMLRIACEKAEIPESAVVMEYPYSRDY